MVMGEDGGKFSSFISVYFKDEWVWGWVFRKKWSGKFKFNHIFVGLRKLTKNLSHLFLEI